MLSGDKKKFALGIATTFVCVSLFSAVFIAGLTFPSVAMFTGRMLLWATSILGALLIIILGVIATYATFVIWGDWTEREIERIRRKNNA